ncbi:hypothetical protein GCM10010371_53540 [Streptomyces subrutilus]|uniref:Uncharacterized protein n=1 Tax=Streptomyces subrutilus TaxID=36818 RepID=A0A5P2UCY6_9ACTN|nr:hypothetical protein CP968_01345 [Streptomyces subrutilus]GGZ86848.1 hypothetical protein GCM10010371_53540 [Streptomyces subrutilus]
MHTHTPTPRSSVPHAAHSHDLIRVHGARENDLKDGGITGPCGSGRPACGSPAAAVVPPPRVAWSGPGRAVAAGPCAAAGSGRAGGRTSGATPLPGPAGRTFICPGTVLSYRSKNEVTTPAAPVGATAAGAATTAPA